MIERIAITGSSGAYGRGLIACIRRVAPAVRILGVDRASPAAAPPDEFVSADIRSPATRDGIIRFQPDTVVHLAYAVSPLRNDAEMRDINVGGAMNVMEAVRTIRPRRFQCCSSATVYGALPDNPVPVDETWPVRSCGSFRYALDKVELEGAIASLARELPDVIVSWTRPAVICGPGVHSNMIDVLLRFPIILLPDGRDVPMQFVHVDDLASATWEILSRDGCGPFNVGPPDWTTFSEIARMTGRRRLRVPYWFMRLLARIGWSLRFPPPIVPPGFTDFLRHPWVVAPTRLEQEFGFRFQHASSDVVAERWREHMQSRNGTPGS